MQSLTSRSRAPVPRSQVDETVARSQVVVASEVSPRKCKASRKGRPSNCSAAEDERMFSKLFGSPDRQPQVPWPDDTASANANTNRDTKDKHGKNPEPKTSAKPGGAAVPATPTTAPKRKATKLSGTGRGRKPRAKSQVSEKIVTFAGHRAPSHPTKRAMFMQIKEEYARLRTQSSLREAANASKPLDGEGGKKKNQHPITTFTQKKFMQHMRASIKSSTKKGMDSHHAFAKAAYDWTKKHSQVAAP